MAILKVARLGHPVLRQVAEPVDPASLARPEVQGFIDDLIESMYEHDGTGLAAPQVHVSSRIVVYQVDGPEPGSQEVPLTVLVNPVVRLATDEREEGWEGCLSLPDLRGRVSRATRVEVEALDRDGNGLKFTARGFHARVIQHETDHLDGVLYVDRMDDMSSLCFLDEFYRYAES